MSSKFYIAQGGKLFPTFSQFSFKGGGNWQRHSAVYIQN